MQRRGRGRVRNNYKVNKNIKVIILFIVLLLIVMLFSVMFSLINIGNSKIIKGVKIGNIDLSNLTQQEAKDKLKEFKENTLLKEIIVKNGEFTDYINIQELDLEFDIDKLVKEACLVGRSGNIIKDNYEILFSLIFNKNINYEINLNEEKLNKKIKEINIELPNVMEESNYYIEDDELIITKGKSGIKIEEEKLKEKIYKALEEENKELEIPVKEVNPTQIDISKIQEEICKEPQNAYISEDLKEVKAHINGIDFDISTQEINQMLLEEKEEYIIPLKVTIPEVTLSDLGKEAFPNLLGSFSTKYDSTNENRTINLELSSEKIDGTIILPGETFSYNKIVGQRTIAKGYKEAAVYSGGKVVNGIGGGICQLSSTLYNAVIYANLEITQRYNHRFLTSYVTAGRDATVSYRYT